MMKGQEYFANIDWQGKIKQGDTCEIVTTPKGLVHEYSVKNTRTLKLLAMSEVEFESIFLGGKTNEAAQQIGKDIFKGPQRVKRVMVNAQILFDMSKPGRRYTVLESYPRDAEFRGATIDPFTQTIYLWVEHPSFPPVEADQVPGEILIHGKVDPL